MKKIITNHGMWVPEHIFQSVWNGENRVIYIEDDYFIKEGDGFDLITEYDGFPKIIKAQVEYTEVFTDHEGEDIIAITLEILDYKDSDEIFQQLNCDEMNVNKRFKK